MHKTNKTTYCPPEAEEVVVRMEAAILSTTTQEFGEEEDCIFDDGNN